MTDEGEQGQGNTAGIPKITQINATDPTPPTATSASPPEPPHAEVAPRRHNDGNHRRKKKGRDVQVHLKTVGLVAAIVASALAYWQWSEQSSQGKFERHQRVRELALQLASFWEAQLEPETRYLVGRLTAKLKALPTDEERNALVRSLLDPRNLIDSDAILKNPENKQLLELIQPELGSANPNGAAMTPTVAVARYKAAAIKVLNTMEAIAIVKEYSGDFPEGLEVIDRAYSGAILQQYRRMKPFVHEYHRQSDRDRRRKAWERLIKMAEEEEQKLNQPAAVARR